MADATISPRRSRSIRLGNRVRVALAASWLFHLGLLLWMASSLRPFDGPFFSTEREAGEPGIVLQGTYVADNRDLRFEWFRAETLQMSAETLPTADPRLEHASSLCSAVDSVERSASPSAKLFSLRPSREIPLARTSRPTVRAQLARAKRYSPTAEGGRLSLGEPTPTRPALGRPRIGGILPVAIHDIPTLPHPFSRAAEESEIRVNIHAEHPPLAIDFLDDQRRRTIGRVVVLVRVAADGSVTSASVHRSSGEERLDQIALTSIRTWQFSPAESPDAAPRELAVAVQPSLPKPEKEVVKPFGVVREFPRAR